MEIIKIMIDVAIVAVAVVVVVSRVVTSLLLLFVCSFLFF